MRNFPLILIALIVIHVDQAWACKCAWQGPFLEVASATPIIVKGRVIAHSSEQPIPLSFDFRVDNALRGEVGGNIKIYGDNGMMCRPYVSKFPVNSEWVLALGHSSSAREQKGSFAISGCGAYWLQFSGTEVVGSIQTPAKIDTKQRMSFEELQAKLDS